MVALIATGPCLAADVLSPDGRIKFTVETGYLGVPQYTLSFDGEVVVGASKLGLRFAAHRGFDRDLELADTKSRSHDATWEQPWGESRLVRDRYNETIFVFHATDGEPREFGLRVRVFDDGVGFRYEVPEQDGFADLGIVDELTEFKLPADATAFWQPGDSYLKYETLYRRSGLEAINNAHTPLTLSLPSGVHLSIHEAALLDYPAYVLEQRHPNVLRTRLRPWSDGIRAHVRTPFTTPWRTIQLAEDAVGLLNSDLILNLNEPNVLGDVSWVEPGKFVGIWWGLHLGKWTWGAGPKHGATTENAMRYVDFAAEHGFDGVLVEGWNTGWNGDWVADQRFSFTAAYADFDIEEVSRYAREKGVRLIAHHETGGHASDYEARIDDAYAFLDELDVRQVKTGYVGWAGSLKRVDDAGLRHYEWHDGQFAVRHHVKVLEAAAQHKLSINAHEPVKDTGLRRTYPNWLTREGSRGQEFAIYGQTPNPPEHEPMLAFTRMLGGPMDYTPGIFDLQFERDDGAQPVQTTLMKQLALYVVLYSPVQMVSDLVENYERHPDAFQFIVDVPTDWERSVALAGEVGDYVVYARQQRGTKDWYLGAVSDERERDLQVPLSFLSAGSTYEATVYRDGERAHWRDNPYDYVIETATVTNEDTLELKLAAGGGAAVRFRSIDKAEKE